MFFSIGFFVYWSAAGKKILARRRRKKNCGQNTPKLRKHLRTSALPQFWPFFPQFTLKFPRKKKHWSSRVGVFLYQRKLKQLLYELVLKASKCLHVLK